MPNPFLLSTLRTVFRAVQRFDRRAEPFAPAAVRRILVVASTAIGDTLLSTPAIRQLRRRYPAATITALVSRNAWEILQGNPHLDGFIHHPGRVNLRYLFRLPGLLRQLRGTRPDLAVVLHANDPDILPLVYASGAAHRYGWAESKLAFLLNLPVATRQPELHALTEKMRNLRLLGIEAEDEQMEMFLTDAERAAAARFLRDRSLAGPYFCLHPFGNRRNRWWLRRDYLTELGTGIRARFGVPLVVVGGPRERAQVRDLGELGPGVVSSVGELKLRETAALLAGSALAISTDSGPLHIAQAFGIPTVGLFGPSLPAITGPRQPNSLALRVDAPCSPCQLHRCDDQRCLEAITPAMVLDAISRLSPPAARP